MVGPELVFSPDHNLLMYPRSILITPAEDDLESNLDMDDTETDSSISLSEDEEPPVVKPGKKDFH